MRLHTNMARNGGGGGGGWDAELMYVRFPCNSLEDVRCTLRILIDVVHE